MGPAPMYHQGNMGMQDMGMAMGMKSEASPPTPRSLRLMPNTSGPSYGQNTGGYMNLGNYTSDTMQSQQSYHSGYGGHDRQCYGGMQPTATATAAAIAAAKKKSIKSSLGRLFSKKEKVCLLSTDFKNMMMLMFVAANGTWDGCTTVVFI